jgi:L-seryl-tRNA(Ser) seleniumtransferase
MKLGKEEAIGMLMAIEMWMKRDHKAEMDSWMSWMQSIANRVSEIEGVTAAVREPRELSNHTPVLNISWDAAKLGITGQRLAEILDTTEPRISLGGSGGRGGAAGSRTGVSITAYMMSPGEDKIVGDRIHAVLSAHRTPKQTEQPKPPAGDLTGRWDVHIDFAAGSSDEMLHLKQDGNQIAGTHQGAFVTRDCRGAIAGDEVTLTSSIGEQHGAALSYRFSGKLNGDTASGTLDMGEYLGATWTARRHDFGRRNES